MLAKIITIKDLNYFSLCSFNLFNTQMLQFELNYWNKWTFPWHSNLLRCTCIHTLQSAADGCNNRMPVSIGSFSYTRSGLVSLVRSQFHRSSNVTWSDRLKGNSADAGWWWFWLRGWWWWMHWVLRAQKLKISQGSCCSNWKISERYIQCLRRWPQCLYVLSQTHTDSVASNVVSVKKKNL